MKFYFKAKNIEGELREGQIEALDRVDAINIIQEKGLIPIDVSKEGGDDFGALSRSFEKFWEGVKKQELVVFFREFATLIEAKVSIVVALQAIEEQTENRFLGMVLLEIIENIEDGLPLSEAMAKHKDLFTPLMINMVKSGEVSGNLQKSISFIAENTERNYQLNSKIKSALMYPTFILSAAIAIGFIVFTFILPKLMKIFDEMNVVIPWYTKVLMTIGSFMQSYWWAVLIVMVGFAAGIAYYVKTESGKRELDQIKIKIPILGKLFQYIYISMFSENLSVLLHGGIPIVRALTIVGEVVNNDVYQKIIMMAAEEVKKGGGMSNVFSRHDEFPPIVSKMIKIGEETGKISEVLGKVSSFYGQEIDRFTRNMTALIEPVLIVVLGVGVGILVVSILMPIYNITSQIQ